MPNWLQKVTQRGGLNHIYKELHISSVKQCEKFNTCPSSLELANIYVMGDPTLHTKAFYTM